MNKKKSTDQRSTEAVVRSRSIEFAEWIFENSLHRVRSTGHWINFYTGVKRVIAKDTKKLHKIFKQGKGLPNGFR